jgi:hypothetical protein
VTLLLAFPGDVRPTFLSWSTDPDRWLRRTSIICQLDAKERTDVALLSTTIRANAADPDFFVRKAIGWACANTPGSTRTGCAGSSPTTSSARSPGARQ